MRKRAGMRLTADLMMDHSLDDHSNAGVSSAVNFTFLSFLGRKVNGFTTVIITMLYQGSTLTAGSSGNIVGDPPIAVLPTGWTPPENIEGIFNKNDNGNGDCTISNNGTIAIKTLSANGTIASGNIVTAYFTWISEND